MSVVKNSLKSIISFGQNGGNINNNDYNEISNSNTESQSNYINRYEPFEYNTDTMIIHNHSNSNPINSNPDNQLIVNLCGHTTDDTTQTDDDDNISIATYGTTKDCLDDDLQSELNMMSPTQILDSM